MNKKQYLLSLIAILFITMLIISGSTFAYMRWITSGDERTALDIAVTEKINMHIDNPSASETGMYPTINCGGDAGMSFVSTVTIENQTGVLAAPNFKLKVKITDINGNIITNEKSTMDVQNGGNNPFRYYINYAVTEENGDCTEPLYTGRFDVNQATVSGSSDWYDSELITLTNPSSGFPLVDNGINGGVSFYANAYKTTTHNYKVWAWVDSSYTTIVYGDDSTTDKLQDATITVSFSQNSTVEQVRRELIGDAYAVYSADDNSLRFYRSETPIEVGSEYKGLRATAVYTGFEDMIFSEMQDVPWIKDGVRNSITKVIVEDTILPKNTSWWFYLTKVTSIDVTKLDTSELIDASRMFVGAGQFATTFTITGLDDWDTSNVINMENMFGSAGESATTWSIGNLSGWDVSNVTDMSSMFSYTGYEATNWSIGDISGWDTSNVIDMAEMFRGSGMDAANNWSLNLNGWDVSKVIYWDNFNYNLNDKIIPPDWNIEDAIIYAVYSTDDNSLRFYDTSDIIEEGSVYNGKSVSKLYYIFEKSDFSMDSFNRPWDVYIYYITEVVVEDYIYPINVAGWFASLEQCASIDVTKMNTSSATDMSYMFYNVGNDVATFTITGLNSFDTSKVTDMSYMFSGIGYSATNSWTLDLSGWNTSKVTNMNSMFQNAGLKSTIFTIAGLENFDTSKVTDMSYMFKQTGYSSTNNWTLNLSGWDTSNVIDMESMFDNFGYATIDNFELNLSGWNTSKVISMNSMFINAGRNVTTFTITGLDGWDTSKVMNMGSMFSFAGRSATTWSIGDLSGWDTSRVLDMERMFYYAGNSATNNWTLDLSSWNVCNVFFHSSFKSYIGLGVIKPPNWGMDCPT